MRKYWFRLDTAALIFPAIMRRNWRNVFRLSVTTKEELDPRLLQQAVNDLMPRFPSLYVRLCAGVFWYYLEQSKRPPQVREDYAYPLSHMRAHELHTCCLRVFYYKNRIAVEFFHALTDGHGGSVYLRSLLARYLYLRFGTRTPPDPEILTVDETPSPDELEDSFLKNSGDYAAGRSEETAYRLSGTPEKGGFRHLITGKIETRRLVDMAHAYDCTVTAFLAAVMARCILDIQSRERPIHRQKPVKITLPVDLRKLYGSRTLRNFALTLNIGVHPKWGEYTLQEICSSIRHQLAAEATPQNMRARIAANVLPQRSLPLRLTPRFLKDLVMGFIYWNSGERKGCLNLSNLGVLRLPEALGAHVERFDFIIGVQRSYPNNCSVVSYGGNTYINFIRTIRETELERRFFSTLVELGLPVAVESNAR